jgi:hypothetical protein
MVVMAAPSLERMEEVVAVVRPAQGLMAQPLLEVMAAPELHLLSLVGRLHMLAAEAGSLTPVILLALAVLVVVEMEPQTMC